MIQHEMPVAIRRTQSPIDISDEQRLDIFDLMREGHLTDRGATPEDLGLELAERRARFMANATWIIGAADEIYNRFTNEMRRNEPEIIKMIRMAQQGLKGPRLNRDRLPEMLDTCEKVLHVYDTTGVTMEARVEAVRISGPCGSCGRPVPGATHAFVTLTRSTEGDCAVGGLKPACHECVAAGKNPENAILVRNEPGE